MKYPELSPSDDKLLVGWLDNKNDYQTGSTPIGLLDIIFDLCKTSRYEVFRSMTPCQICYSTMESIREATFSGCGIEKYAVHSKSGERILLGSSTIIFQFEDRKYVAPDLIWHYISEHNYLPPKEFINAVYEKKKSKWSKIKGLFIRT
ncbi:DUF7919 family protein [Dongshaea marina]|uniref:DUF7919 family protein n=1 Tax=Dongshaea marina TaxID=2047966 RepID=UPI000D3E1F03|nr:hypothetical protein [Dongshaea marina]